MARHAGIEIRHSKVCRSRTGGACSCRPTYQASVWSAVEQKRIRKTFSTLAEAKAWRSEAQTAIRRGTLRAPSQMTLRDAAEAWLEGARAGSIRNRLATTTNQVSSAATKPRSDSASFPSWATVSSRRSGAGTSKTSPTGFSARASIRPRSATRSTLFV
jgi:hypothetical protein